MKWGVLALLILLLPLASAHGLEMDYISVQIEEDFVLVNYSTFRDYPDLETYFAENFEVTNNRVLCGWSAMDTVNFPGTDLRIYQYEYNCGKPIWLNFTYNLFFDQEPNHQVPANFKVLTAGQEHIFTNKERIFQVPLKELFDNSGTTWEKERAKREIVPVISTGTPDEERIENLEIRVAALEKSLQSLDSSVDALQTGQKPERTKSPSSFLHFLWMGIKHILIGYDHILFLIGLLLVASHLRPLLVIVTAFTVAHSVTLISAVMDVVSPNMVAVEILIALSIAYVGFENLFYDKKKRHKFFANPDYRWVVAALFGLIHGFGFSSVLKQIGLPPGNIFSSLLAFNIGVEIGQILIVLAVIPLIWYSSKKKWWPNVLKICSACLIAAGLFWFAVRFLGI